MRTCHTHLAAWRARVETFGETEEMLLASYPDAVASSLGIARTWMPVLLQDAAPAGRPTDAMPELAQLTAGLDEMLRKSSPDYRKTTLQRTERASSSTR